MQRTLKPYIIVLAVAAMLVVPFGSTALAQNSDEDKQLTVGKMAVDALIVRPLGIAAIIVGTALFVVSLPFSALGGNTKNAYERLIVDPVKFTFKRPLGDFDQY